MPELQLCPLKCQSCGVAMHLNYPKVLNNPVAYGKRKAITAIKATQISGYKDLLSLIGIQSEMV